MNRRRSSIAKKENNSFAWLGFAFLSLAITCPAQALQATLSWSWSSKFTLAAGDVAYVALHVLIKMIMFYSREKRLPKLSEHPLKSSKPEDPTHQK